MSDSRHGAADYDQNLVGPDPRIDVYDIRRNWGWLLAFGIAMIVGGTAAVVLPFAASLGVWIAVGAALAVCGIFQAIHAFRARSWKGRGWAGINALLYIGGAVLLLLDPLAGLVALTAIVIAIIAAAGILRMIMAVRIRPESGWGWLLASGILALILAGTMLYLFPQISMTALGILVGVTLIFEGWAFVLLSLAARRAD